MDSCTAQTLGRYGEYIFDGEALDSTDRIHGVTGGLANLDALRKIFFINDRALFEWIVSAGSIAEARDKFDSRHMRWVWDIAHHSEACLEEGGPTVESEALAMRVEESKFGYLSTKDRRLIQEAVYLRCEAFLTVERRLPRNAAHLKRELGIHVLTPCQHWKMLQPWAGLWR